VSQARGERRRWTVAVAAYPPGWLGSWEEYACKLGAWVAEAAEQADLLVFPEYAAMELASLAGADDVEFPLLARALVEQGVEVLLVPSCTDTLAGHWRVRVGAMARALEGQCLVAQAVTVGALPWLPAIDSNVGAAAVYAPPDCGFPSHGVLARGVLNQPGWVYAEVDRAAIRRVRAEGDVLNHRHWMEQAGCVVETAGTEVASAAAMHAPALEGALQ
jgi:predicted amidohydrolase